MSGKSDVSIRPGPDGLSIESGDSIAVIPWADCGERLAGATPEQRMQLTVSPSGYGVHWPLLDEDLSIPALLSKRGLEPEVTDRNPTPRIR